MTICGIEMRPVDPADLAEYDWAMREAVVARVATVNAAPTDSVTVNTQTQPPAVKARSRGVIDLRRQTQTSFAPEGNCWQAVAACIIGVPLDELPSQADIERRQASYNNALNRYLTKHHRLLSFR